MANGFSAGINFRYRISTRTPIPWTHFWLSFARCSPTVYSSLSLTNWARSFFRNRKAMRVLSNAPTPGKVAGKGRRAGKW